MTISTFLDGVLSSRNDFARYLREFGMQNEKWKLLSRELESRHPLAFWMISTSLDGSQALSSPCEALYSFFRQILEFFATAGGDLIQMLKRLQSLAIRFEDQTRIAINVDWSCPFSADCSFLDCIDEPDKLAESITKAQCEFFKRLSLKDFRDPKSNQQSYLRKEWLALSNDVAACVTSDINLLAPAMRLGENLVYLKNYHAAAAVGCGLYQAGPWSEKEWPVWEIISPKSLMASSRDKAGLPYLEPLICILERSKDEDVIGVLHRIYEYVTYFEGNERLRGNRLPTHDEKPVEKEHLYTPFSVEQIESLSSPISTSTLSSPSNNDSREQNVSDPPYSTNDIQLLEKLIDEAWRQDMNRHVDPEQETSKVIQLELESLLKAVNELVDKSCKDLDKEARHPMFVSENEKYRLPGCDRLKIHAEELEANPLMYVLETGSDRSKIRATARRKRERERKKTLRPLSIRMK